MEYESGKSKIIYFNKNKKITFLKDFVEISPMGTLNEDYVSISASTHVPSIISLYYTLTVMNTILSLWRSDCDKRKYFYNVRK